MITRTRLDRCSTKDCPWPLDEEIHVPWCSSIPSVPHQREATHQHWPKRSQGGTEIVAILCAYCHDRVDNGAEWSNAVLTLADGTRYYRMWDRKNVTLIERVLGPTGSVEAPLTDGVAPQAEVIEPPPLTLPAGSQSRGSRGASGQSLPSFSTSGQSSKASEPAMTSPGYSFRENGIEFEPEITLAMWVAAAKRIASESKGRQWKVGDLVNREAWHECSQYIDEIEYPEQTQANYGRVAAAYPLEERRSKSFGHHQAVYRHPERLRLLDEAIENGWTVKELREAAGLGRIRIRRYTVEELRERVEQWHDGYGSNADTAEFYVNDFVSWLGASEEGSAT